ncbi:MAG TPA: TetR family transcriptional regulator [Gemmatimonadales bacterium]|nr:TetR family transcriptional regulator [Gemmatimonadales bacterium]
MTVSHQGSRLTAPRRARSPEAKQRRRSAILDEALRQLEKTGFDRIAMSDIARATGVAKGTLYLYFQTKEELFLALLQRLLDDWLDQLDSALAAGAHRLPAAALTALFAESLTARPALRRLLALQGPVLEQNVEYERALRLKWRLAGRLTATGSQLERRTVFLRPGDGTRLLLAIQALTVGLQVQAEPAPVVRRILEAPGLEALRLEFDREFRVAAGALLTGLERTN